LAWPELIKLILAVLDVSLTMDLSLHRLHVVIKQKVFTFIWHNSSPWLELGQTGQNYEFLGIERRSGNIGTSVRWRDYRSCSDRSSSAALARPTSRHNDASWYSIPYRDFQTSHIVS